VSDSAVSEAGVDCLVG